jgi:hypothetical protein
VLSILCRVIAVLFRVTEVSSNIPAASDGQDFLAVDGARTTLHGLGDNDMLDGSTTDDILIGGEGDDTLIGNGGNDTFVYKYENAGNDFIDDFTVGNTNTNTNADIIDLRDLLIGYNAYNLSDFEKVLTIGTLLSLTIIKLATINCPVIGILLFINMKTQAMTLLMTLL